MTAGLDLISRAARLGISTREYVAIAEIDWRIVAHPGLSSAATAARLVRWLRAGSPVPNHTRLQFRGCDSVRALLLEVIRAVPTPVAWHAVEHVTWIEVGNSALGWAGRAPSPRAPDDDQGHMIAISGHICPKELELTGLTAREYLAGVIAHELGHSWSSEIVGVHPAAVCPSARESVERYIVIGQALGESLQQLIASRVADERLADQLATLWGFAHSTDELRLRRHLAAEYEAAAEDLADRIAHNAAIAAVNEGAS